MLSVTAQDQPTLTDRSTDQEVVEVLFARKEQLSITWADVARMIPDVTAYDLYHWRKTLAAKTFKRIEPEKREGVLEFLAKPDEEIKAGRRRKGRKDPRPLGAAIDEAAKSPARLPLRGHGRAVVMTDTLAHQVERGLLTADDAVALAQDIADAQHYTAAEREYVREWAGDDNTLRE